MLTDGVPLVTVSALPGHRSPVITTIIEADAVRGQTDQAIARQAQRTLSGTGTTSIRRAGDGVLGELAPPYQTSGILIGAVDTASGRRAIHEALARSSWRLWLNIGNERDWGKVLLGTATEQRQLRGALSVGGLCTALPAASLRYPHLLDEGADQLQGDCAGDMRDGLQSLMINQAMAAIAAQYLHQLISARCVTSFETALDLANLTMTSTSITAATLAEASGLTVAEIALTDEPKHQQKRVQP